MRAESLRIVRSLTDAFTTELERVTSENIALRQMLREVIQDIPHWNEDKKRRAHALLDGLDQIPCAPMPEDASRGEDSGRSKGSLAVTKSSSLPIF